MKNTIIILIILIFSLHCRSNLFAFFHNGGDKDNGGDICEQKFLKIRDDLSNWVSNGDLLDINLPESIPIPLYRRKMLNAFQFSIVSCTDEKVYVGKSEKTCKNYMDINGDNRIECNRDLFMNKTDVDDRYILVHHEYAGIADFETNRSKEESRYFISENISAATVINFKKRSEIIKNTPNFLRFSNDEYFLAHGFGPLSFEVLKRHIFSSNERSSIRSPGFLLLDQGESIALKIQLPDGNDLISLRFSPSLDGHYVDVYLLEDTILQGISPVLLARENSDKNKKYNSEALHTEFNVSFTPHLFDDKSFSLDIGLFLKNRMIEGRKRRSFMFKLELEQINSIPFWHILYLKSDGEIQSLIFTPSAKND